MQPEDERHGQPTLGEVPRTAHDRGHHASWLRALDPPPHPAAAGSTVLNGAFIRAVRWRWIGTNPVGQGQAPFQPTPDPRPPTPAQAARVAAEAWKDPDWGMFVWLAMTTGARRGELCALRWDRIDFVTGVLDIRTSIAQVNTRMWEKDTKTHQRRWIVLDAQTIALLRTYLQHVARRSASLGIELSDGSFVFSGSPDGSTCLKPDTVTQRYSRMCARLGWDMHIHQLRHYSATELIAAGVDDRTVADGLGTGAAEPRRSGSIAPGSRRQTSAPQAPSPRACQCCLPQRRGTARQRCPSPRTPRTLATAPTGELPPTFGPPSGAVRWVSASICRRSRSSPSATPCPRGQHTVRWHYSQRAVRSPYPVANGRSSSNDGPWALHDPQQTSYDARLDPAQPAARGPARGDHSV